ncbi:MAG: hypothetical protein IKT14_04150 [Clostridiales bacterium]|nr:hypothetical protein [Clostridiales bacterium]
MSERLVIPRVGYPSTQRSAIGQREPLAHPKNCRTECPYGRGRAFCFPCMAKIVFEHRAARGLDNTDEEGLASVPVM